MDRIFHPYTKWEDFKAGMWRTIHGPPRNIFLKEAIKFTGNAELYGKFMFRVIREWPYACEHNLSNLTINRKAWLGHAACCLAINCPEDITREAWKYLTKKQQDEANYKAKLAIEKWEQKHA